MLTKLNKRRPRPRTAVAGRVAKAASPMAVQRGTASASSRVCLGILVDWDDKGPLVDFDGNRGAPVRARVSSAAGRVRAPRPREPREVVLLVDSRTSKPPVLLGLLQPLDADPSSGELDARVDGQRVELEGRDEVVLVCGEASITLRRNGRILIRGVQVETRASGVNRIRGGSVAIN